MVFVDNNRSIFFTSYILEGAIKKFRGSKATLFVKLDTGCLIMKSKIYIHSVAKVYAVFPFYDVKCLCSGGRD